ncbi:aminopeptidase [Cohnella rhizosphaerae]|uniref:Aminopeptidase n=1 Tax=Cohnella rhizosphaerae TaxID=1457232 RepID=A0A9X4L264_9BACL|nr:aminopeptidase [Cohnella rhizosphaerae]MDG0812167.1 aminopeptidase [Cohnella rhizosphaerae]
MEPFEQQLARYAELIVKVGANVRQGQEVFVVSQIETAQLTRLVAAAAYDAGASNVHVDWSDDKVSRLKYDHAAPEVFRTFPSWETLKRNHFVEKEACFISFVSSGPDVLKGVDPQRIGDYQKAAGAGLSDFRRAIQSDKVAWTVAAAASNDWAQKVFPGDAPEIALGKLWLAIFDAVRLHADDPVQAWREHDRILHGKVDWLNGLRLRKLHYKAAGTDLTVELPDRHLWVGASSVTPAGVSFMANMPTEEVFTAPKRDGVNGYVSSTKPLSYAGNIIDRFKLTFALGRIVQVEAEEGEEILRQLVETDEGSHYLGEMALVPHRSPISESNILFYNTLFDENASNHFAIGSGYAFNVEGGKTMTPEELAANGVNASVAHVDFMVGSAEMDIDGFLEDGTIVPIFRNGNWA